MNRVVALALTGVCLGCAPHAEPDASYAATRVEAEADARGSTVLATLTTRDYRLDILAGRSGDEPRFTVASARGDAIASDVSLPELAARFPTLHRQFETAFAGEGVTVDASVTPPEAQSLRPAPL